MPLQDVLALLGEAVHRDAAPREVRQLIDTAPGLTDAEREDLRRIPYERLRPYQQDFYAFEASMLRWGFECTWAALKEAAFGVAEANGRTPQRAFMVRFKNRYPSATHSSREMARNFLQFLSNDCRHITDAMPWLPELADMEQREIDVLYAMDSPYGRSVNGAELSTLFERSVDALLRLSVVRAEAVSAVRYAHDLPAIKRAIRDTPDRLPTDPAPTALVIARNPDTLLPVWYRIQAWEADLINGVSESEPATVDTLTDPFCEAYERAYPDAGDEQLLAALLQWLATGFRRRIFLQA